MGGEAIALGKQRRSGMDEHVDIEVGLPDIAKMGCVGECKKKRHEGLLIWCGLVRKDCQSFLLDSSRICGCMG